MSSRQVHHEGRQRMKPWLEYHINDGETPGLAWLDRQLKIFKVPWKHVGNREWSESDGTIFKMWAVHTGRYRENVDQPDWPTWKTRFRCALTKLPDIKERKEMNRLDGQTEEPYRVYQFVERTNNENLDPRSNSRRGSEDFFMDENSFHREAFTPGPYEPRLPTVLTSDPTGSSQLDSDLMNIESGDLVQCDSSDIREAMNDSGLMEGVEDAGDPSEDVQAVRVIGRKCYPGQDRPNTLTVPSSYYALDQTDCKLYVTVKYLLLRVFEKLCANPNGCRIFYDKHVPITDPHEFNEMYGPTMAEAFSLPECSQNMMNPQQQKLTLDLLNAADRGLILQVKNGSIYATRKCRCRIYISTPSINNGETVKLERDNETNIFDLDKYFKPALNRYIQQSGPKPSAEVLIAFGQNFRNDRESLNNLLVSASVLHTEAYNLLTRIHCSSQMSPVEISHSNDLDQKLDLDQHRRFQDIP